MKIEVILKSGSIFTGEFRSRKSMLTFISIPNNEVENEVIEFLLTKKTDGVYSIDLNSDGSLNIALENEAIESVKVK